eukprot:CAMPEP_0172480934 /NCGR_PEP_ID=MMETSP1066-20121228/6467_1 /TAXON_ID=671091 /ORGANISM="Coscinodiscus wailesii, Strain CCMP2513" /LENGTH=204 /DNA_ID=CAMNT_0013242763 /DNA_START=217 /DNA_END=828 /DNA_ORIENTATION=-
MYPRNQNNASMPGLNNNRRAFRDVTNASNSTSIGHDNIPMKRSSAALQSGFGSHVPIRCENPAKNNSRRYAEEKVTIDTELNTHVRPYNKNFSRNDGLGTAVLPHRKTISQTSSASYQHSAPADDIDERDVDDPLCTTDYVEDMYAHFRMKETSTAVRPGYMEKQCQINERMRSILVDWLVEVHLKFKLVPETLYLTINLIDRY